jgi:hypothetical protein
VGEVGSGKTTVLTELSWRVQLSGGWATQQLGKVTQVEYICDRGGRPGVGSVAAAAATAATAATLAVAVPVAGRRFPIRRPAAQRGSEHT